MLDTWKINHGEVNVKVAISGSDGTGKTTLVNEISKRFNVPIVPEFARDVAEEMNIPDLAGMSPSLAYSFQLEVMDRKIKEEQKHESFIADRCTADNLAYYTRQCSRDLPDAANSHYVDMCLENLKKYDKIFLLMPNSIPLCDDGFRSTKKYHLYGIYCLIRGILEDAKAKYEVIQESDMEKRIKTIGYYFTKCKACGTRHVDPRTGGDLCVPCFTSNA